MSIAYGDLSNTRSREVYQSDVKNTLIIAPSSANTLGSPITVTYVLESDKEVDATVVEFEYKYYNGTAWSSYATCTDMGSAESEGTTNLSAAADGTTHTFVWDALTDLGGAFDNSVVVRLRCYDGTYYDNYINSEEISVTLVPIVTISSPSSGTLGGSIDIDYTISTLVSASSFSIEAQYSTDSGSSWAACTEDITDPDDDGIVGLSVGTHTFVWDAETDLGATYFGSTVEVQVRADNGTATGDYAQSSVFTVDMFPHVSIALPSADKSYGSPINVQYTITSLRDVTPFSITAEYRPGGSTTWYTCTEDTTDADDEGTTGLAQGSHIFVWDSGTDLTTAYQSDDVQVRVSANDGTNDSDATSSGIFTVDMLPVAPTLLSPFDTYFDIGDGAQFTWQIPADPGADKIHFEFMIDEKDTGTSIIDHNTADNYLQFDHYIDTVNSLKNGANGISYFVQSLSVTSLTGTTVSFADLTDHYKESSLPASLTNPKILIVNKADCHAYVPPSSITATGFDIYKRSFGGSGDAEVDVLIFEGAASSFDSYWKTITITGDTTLTFGTSPLDTDDLGNTIPSSITNCRVEILEGGDQPVYIYSSSDSGLVIKKTTYGDGSDPTIMVMLRGTPSDTYQDREYTVSPSGGESDIRYLTYLTDQTNGGAAWPAYIPGIILTTTHRAERFVYSRNIFSDGLFCQECGYGPAVDANVDIVGSGEANSSVPYYNDVSPRGVPDDYEGETARYTVSTSDDLADGLYIWSVQAGNET